MCKANEANYYCIIPILIPGSERAFAPNPFLKQQTSYNNTETRPTLQTFT